MRISTKVKKALSTLRKEFGLTETMIHTLLGNTVSLDMIQKFENATSVEDECLTSFYLELFSFIVFQRLRFEVQAENFDYEPDEEIIDLPEGQPRFNPFKRN